jgi:hypothetical protein
MRDGLLQRWCLVGLEPMHDALIRRLAIEASVMHGQESNRELSIAWSTSPSFHDCDGWWRPENIDVLIAATDQVADILQEFQETLPFDPAGSGSTDPRCLRLLWSGLEENLGDYAQASAWFAHGAIVDLLSLQSWIQVAVRKAAWIPKPPHLFLRDLKLPSA